MPELLEGRGLAEVSRPPGRVRLPGKEASLKLNVCRRMFRGKMGPPLAREVTDKVSLRI